MKSVETNHELRSGLSARGLCHGVAALLLGAVVLVSGCSKESPDGGVPDVGGARVTLSFTSDGPLHAVDREAMKARGMAASSSATSSAFVPAPATGTEPATRGVLNPSMVDEWAVADLWVLQYDMSGGAEGSLAARYYVGSVVQEGAAVRVTADLEPMDKARIVVLANAPGSLSEDVLPTGSTLADLDALTFDITAASGSALPEEYSFALPMRGDSEGELKLETGQVATVRMPFYRLVSKVTLMVDNRCSEGFPNLTLTRVSLRNVPTAGSYARVTAATHASTRYPAAASGNFKDYDALTEGLGTQCELLWYLAPNSRGTGIGTGPTDKTAANAPSGEGDYCTYAYVEGLIEPSEGGIMMPITYRVYLGGNATNDYNVWANESYRIKMTIRELPENPAIEVGHDGFTVELVATEGFHRNTVDGWYGSEVGISSAQISPSTFINPEGGTTKVVLTGRFPSGGVALKAVSGSRTLATGQATVSGVGVDLSVGSYEGTVDRKIEYYYEWNGSWVLIGSRMQSFEKVLDTGGSSTLLEYYDNGQQLPWRKAAEYCRALGAGWRLPTMNEAMYYWCVTPIIDEKDRYEEAHYWTSTMYTATTAFAQNFKAGITVDHQNEMTRSFHVRCVKNKSGVEQVMRFPRVLSENGGVIVELRDGDKGMEEPALFDRRFDKTQSGNETSASNLMSRRFRVQKKQGITVGVNWNTAVHYCDNLVAEGYDDWRLPSQREAMMMWLMGASTNVQIGDRDDTGIVSSGTRIGSSYLYDQAGFEPFPWENTWTATICAYYGGTGPWDTDYEDGNNVPSGTHPNYNYKYNVRCVRDEPW